MSWANLAKESNDRWHQFRYYRYLLSGTRNVLNSIPYDFSKNELNDKKNMDWLWGSKPTFGRGGTTNRPWQNTAHYKAWKYGVPRKPVPLAVRNKRKINSLMKEKEWKFKDDAFDFTVAATGTLNHLTAIAQGDEEQMRDGEKVTIRSISFKLRLVTHSSAVTPRQVRVVCFVDWYGRTTPTLNTAAETDLITQGGTSVIQHFNQDNRSRYTILYDKWFVICPDGDASVNFSGNPTMAFDKYFKKKKFACHYDGTTGAAVAKGQVYIYVWSDSSVNAPTCVMDSRVFFTEA